jgi:hypothetical protein
LRHKFVCGLVRLSILILSFAPYLFAGDITIFAGFQNPKDRISTLQVGRVGPREIPFDTSLGSVFGARLSWGKRLGFEQSLALSPHFFDSHLHAFNTQSTIVINISTSRIIPYATAGAGVVTTWGDSIRDIGTKFMLNYGGGVKFSHLAGPISFRLDLRGYTIPNVLEI